MKFSTGWNKETNRFTLSSYGIVGKINVEEFDCVEALDFKIEALEKNGHHVNIGYDISSAPVEPIAEFFRY